MSTAAATSSGSAVAPAVMSAVLISAEVMLCVWNMWE
jgi:hypothetical protein